MMTPFKSTTCFSRNGKPLTSYSNEYEAADGADYVKIAHGLALVPYQCNRCGYWHLSPQKYKTPNKDCVYCVKQLYEKMESAKTRARIIENERGIKLKIYKCRHQNGYHLTHT